MNTKQLIFMWIGITTIMFLAFATIVDTYRPDYANFAVWVFLVAIVTSGLIYTLRDKKRQESKARKPINLISGLRRITLVLAIVTAFISAYIAVVIVVEKHSNEQDNLLYIKLDFEARQLKNSPEAKTDIWSEAAQKVTGEQQVSWGLNDPKIEERLKELENGFWVNLSQGSLLGLCILAGLCGVAIGYGGVWLVYFLIWLIYRFIKWLVMGFYDVNQES